MRKLSWKEVRKERCRAITSFLNTWLKYPHLVTEKALVHYRWSYIE